MMVVMAVLEFNKTKIVVLNGNENAKYHEQRSPSCCNNSLRQNVRYYFVPCIRRRYTYVYSISMGECNTILGAYTLYRHLG